MLERAGLDVQQGRTKFFWELVGLGRTTRKFRVKIMSFYKL